MFTNMQGNLLHSNELARRYGDKGLIAISLHPGIVRTELFREGNPLFLRILVSQIT